MQRWTTRRSIAGVLDKLCSAGPSGKALPNPGGSPATYHNTTVAACNGSPRTIDVQQWTFQSLKSPRKFVGRRVLYMLLSSVASGRVQRSKTDILTSCMPRYGNNDSWQTYKNHKIIHHLHTTPCPTEQRLPLLVHHILS